MIYTVINEWLPIILVMAAVAPGICLFQLARRLGFGWLVKGLALSSSVSFALAIAIIKFYPGDRVIFPLLMSFSVLVGIGLLAAMAFLRWPITKDKEQNTLVDAFT